MVSRLPLLCGFVLAVLRPVTALSPPTIPQQYYVAFDLELPQWPVSGFSSVVEPVEVWFDGQANQQRYSMISLNCSLDYWGGVDSTYLKKVDAIWWDGYTIWPEGTDLKCGSSHIDISGLANPFPAQLNQFTFQGTETVNGQQCNKWFLHVPSQGATNNYTYYVLSSDNETPVQFLYEGDSGSLFGYLNSPNYDWFLISYTQFLPNYYNASAFVPPAICQSASSSTFKEPISGTALDHLYQVRAPSKLTGPEWRKEYPHVKDTNDERTTRATFRQNAAKVLKHNSPNYRLKLNHFAAQPLSIVGDRAGWRAPDLSQYPAEMFYKPQGTTSSLPASVDWRQSGKVSPLKDQGDCGSCWSFGSTGAVESAYAIKYNKMITLSEQYLMDCSWGNGNNACDGGSQAGSYDYVISQGGAWPSEVQYPYTQNDQFCHQTPTVPGLNLTSWKWVLGEEAMMDALANVGPVTVSVSTFPAYGWAFYHDGVYDDPLCNPLIPDHCVLIVGYGTSESGQDYWILKNQWSQYWGQDGYMLITRGYDDCGVTSFGMIPYIQ